MKDFYIIISIFVVIIISFNCMYRFLIRRKILEFKTRHWNPLFMFIVYVRFLKTAIKERSIVIFWFVIYIFGFALFLYRIGT